MNRLEKQQAKRKDRHEAKRHPGGALRLAAAKKRVTKRWCRGVINRPHQPKCVVYKDYKRSNIGSTWRLLVCTECHKELDCYFPALITGERKDRPKPSWVDC